jgi:dipeptidyl aminopeptidase/acylaminoacyl peptidase
MKIRVKRIGFLIAALVLSSTLIYKFGLSAEATVPIVNELVSANTSSMVANDDSGKPSTSADGRYIAFESSATDIVANDTNGKTDIFVRDTQNDITARVNVTPTGAESDEHAYDPMISYNGDYIVFASTDTDLVSGSTNASGNVYIRNLKTNVTSLVSKSGGSVEANASSYKPAVSADGRIVAFISLADNLVSGITPGTNAQVFIKDMESGGIQTLSIDSGGALGNAPSTDLAMNYGGRLVAFASEASNLVTGDVDGASDIYLSALGISGNILTSVTDAIDGDSSAPSMSCNGNYMAYQSVSTDDGHMRAYLYERLIDDNDVISIDPVTGLVSQGSNPTISGDGKLVAYTTLRNHDSADANDLSADPNDIYIRDWSESTTTLVSRNTTDAVGSSNSPAISANGSKVAFVNTAAASSPYGYLLPTYQNNSQAIYTAETGMGF